MERHRKKLTVYQRIVQNAERGCGTYLTPHETWALSRDDAIATVAFNDTVEQLEQEQGGTRNEPALPAPRCRV